MPRPLLFASAVTAVVLAASCSSGPGPDEDDRTGAIYAAAIRAVIDDHAGDDAGGDAGNDASNDASNDTSDTTEATADVGPVFVASSDPEQSISLEVQAEMVEELHDFATLRFVDEPTEAIDEDDPTQPVADNGVLLELGPIREQDDTATLDVEWYQDVDTTQSYRVRATRSDDVWTATASARP
jgi:hypothetical protein